MHKRVKKYLLSVDAFHDLPVPLIARTPLQPSVECLECILHRGIDERVVSYAPRLYAFMRQVGLDSHMILGNSLTSILIALGNLLSACTVFQRSTLPDEYCWNALIAGLAKCGESQRALRLYKEMHVARPRSNGYTFVALLKACSQLKDAATGRELHAEISATRLLETDIFVGNALIDMYAKCGFLAKAREVFDKLPVKDVVSWTSLIAGYAKHERGKEALDCYEQMQLAGVSSNAVTYVCSLKACGIMEAVDKGCDIHFEISRKGLLEKNLFIGSALVDMYAKCGALAKAQEIFDNLRTRDIVAWNALIGGYAKFEHGKEALDCYAQMQLDGFSPDAATFVSALKACGSIRAADRGEEIRTKIAENGLLQEELAVGNALVDMYAKCGLLGKAQQIFDKLPFQDEISWNALIAGYTMHEEYEKALYCINQMQLEGFSPSDVTLVCFLKACGNIKDLNKGRDIHAKILQKGLLRDNCAIGSALVDMYVKCGLLGKAQEVFDHLLVKNVILWTALIAGYVQHEHSEEALNCLEKMQLEGVLPNAVTYTCGLKACGTMGATDKGRELHAEIARNGLIESDLSIGYTLVDMYAKSGLLAKAQEVFDELPVRDILSWNSLISGYAQLGDTGNALHTFEKLKQEGQKPDSATFVSVLNVCNVAGMLDMGQIYLETMNKDHDINPTIEHHTCIVDLFSRAGQIDMAVAMIKRMPFDPDVVVWRAILDACKKWRNFELGRSAFELVV